MEGPPVVPPSYPDAGARGTTRNLSKLTSQKFIYYGGKNPNPQKERAETPQQNESRSKFIALYKLISTGALNASDPTGVWDEVSSVMPDVYSRNPYILAVAMFIIKTHLTDLSTSAALETEEFREAFQRSMEDVWPNLFGMLTKVQKKKAAKKKIASRDIQALDVYKYVVAYFSFKSP